MIPNVVSWTRLLCMHALSLNLVGFTTLHLIFLKARVLLCSLLQGIAASIGSSNFLLAFLIFFDICARCSVICDVT